MSRREGRDFHNKRLHSRPERESSPKKQRRDGKPATERTHSSSRHLDIVGTVDDRDQKHRRRLKDALPLEGPAVPETTVQADIIKKATDKKVEGIPNVTKSSTDRMEVPRSLSYFQHDERQGGRSLVRRAADHHRWSDPKEQQHHEFDRKVWRHDRFHELDTEAPPARKRPAFSEKKPESSEKLPESSRLPPTFDTVRREERGRGGYHNRGSERPFARVEERESRRGDTWQSRKEGMPRAGYPPRERFHGGLMRGRDSGLTAHRQGGGQMDKWKHDMFTEVNRSPSPKKEEEQIAKVEALLAL